MVQGGLPVGIQFNTVTVIASAARWSSCRFFSAQPPGRPARTFSMYCGGLDSRTRTARPSIGAGTSCRPDDEGELGRDEEGELGTLSVTDAQPLADRAANAMATIAVLTCVSLLSTMSSPPPRSRRDERHG